MPQQLFRVAGSGYTAFTYNGKVLAYVQQIQDTAPQPVAAPAPIHPLDQQHPIEVAFPRAHGMGTLAVQFFDQWSIDVWEQLPGFEGAVDLLDVFDRNLRQGAVSVVRVIKTPDGGTRSTVYHNVVITNVDESETVQIGTMVINKTITMQYTHRTKI